MAFTGGSVWCEHAHKERRPDSQLLQVPDLREGVGLHRHDGVITQISVEGKRKRGEFKILVKSELLFFCFSFATHTLHSLKEKKRSGIQNNKIPGSSLLR